jgi:hypothetical protein
VGAVVLVGQAGESEHHHVGVVAESGVLPQRVLRGVEVVEYRVQGDGGAAVRVFRGAGSDVAASPPRVADARAPGKRGLAFMDSWFVSDSEPKVPEKSLAHLGLSKLALKPQVSATIRAAADMKVKYKETARGGLAVNVVEC